MSLTTTLGSKLTHFDGQGQAHMVDVGAKPATHRIAVAQGRIVMNPATLSIILAGNAKKGDVLGIARVAGIMAAKKTSDLIPLCHGLHLSFVGVRHEVKGDGVWVECRVKTTFGTGCEMEAIIGCMTALATIYDMCKAVDKEMVIGNVKVTRKTGGKSGDYCKSD